MKAITTIMLVAALAAPAYAYPALSVEKTPQVDMQATMQTGKAVYVPDCFMVEVHGMQVLSARVDDWVADMGMGTFLVVAVNNSGIEIPRAQANVDVYSGGKYILSVEGTPAQADGSPIEYGHVYRLGERMYLHGILHGTLGGAKPDIRVRDVTTTLTEGKACR